MEALFNFQGTTSLAPSYLLPKPPPKTTTIMLSNRVTLNFNSFIFPISHLSSSSSSSSFSLHTKPTKSLSLIVNARKKDKKEDNHNCVPKPDEVTGFFPESVLLKKKEVDEDGNLLPEFEDADERELYESLMLEMETDTGADLLRHYEIMYLIHEKYEEEVTAVNEKVQEFLREKKGRIWRLNDWGMRRLAYKIKKANNAHYILMNFELDSKYINEFKTLLDKDERVIRHLVIKMDEAVTEDCPPPPEFHTVIASADDDEDDEDFDDEWDDEDELDDFDEDGEGVFIVDDEDDSEVLEGQTLVK